MSILIGGDAPGNCNCCCGYEGEPGGATSPQNDSANDAAGHTKSYGCDGGGNGEYEEERKLLIMTTGFCRC